MTIPRLGLALGILALMVTACGDRLVSQEIPPTRDLPVISGKLSEVAPPLPLRELSAALDRYAPQVAILSPIADQLFSDTTVKVELQVTDLPVFQDPELGLGPHLSLVLDNEPPREIYDLSGPVLLENLAPGTHTLQVFATRPWYESFKNDGAYTRVTFHVKTKTGSNAPAPNLPLLTYNRPRDRYGAQPILLDFYLANAPLHLVARENETDDIEDWRVRVTVNGESFLLDTWEPIYLQGFETGDNLIKLEFIDEKGNLVENVFNTTARLIIYDPNYEDSLTKLVKGEIPTVIARKIVDPNYTATPVIEEPTVIEEPAVIEEPTVTEEPAVTEEPSVIEEPAVIEDSTVTEEPTIIEEPIAIPLPEPVKLPRLVLPEEDRQIIETPAIEPITLPRLVLPDEEDKTEIQATPPSQPVPVPSVETPPSAKVTSETGNRFLDRVRDTFSRWRSPRNENPEGLQNPS